MSVKQQLVFKNNDFTYLDWWAYFICFFTDYNVMHSKAIQIYWGTQIKKWKNSVLKGSCYHSFLVMFHSLSSSWSVWTYSLVTHSTEKKLQTNDAFILIVTKIFSLAILFQLPSCTLCVNTQISKTVMATAFESVQSIPTTIVTDPKIMYLAFSWFIETIGMECKLAIKYSHIYAPYVTVNYFLQGSHFHL